MPAWPPQPEWLCLHRLILTPLFAISRKGALAISPENTDKVIAMKQESDFRLRHLANVWGLPRCCGCTTRLEEASPRKETRDGETGPEATDGLTSMLSFIGRLRKSGGNARYERDRSMRNVRLWFSRIRRNREKGFFQYWEGP